MTNEKRKQRVQEIHDNIKLLNDELGEIRKRCTHSSHHAGYYSWRVGAVDVVKICDYCNENLGVPTKQEVSDFLKDEKK